MTDLRAAAQQALEALESLQGGCTDSDDGTVEAITVWCPEVIEALRAALAEPVQEPQGCDHCNHPLYAATKCRVCGRVTEPVHEPVAWGVFGANLHDMFFTEEEAHEMARLKGDGSTVAPLYAAPPQRPAEPVQEPVQEPVAFDHGIGADRFRVVRGAFWWHVLIGDSPTEHGKFRSRASAEKMAADLLREFRNGAFVQHEKTAPPQRLPLSDEEISSLWDNHIVPVFGKNGINPIVFARAVEAAHGIGSKA